MNEPSKPQAVQQPITSQVLSDPLSLGDELRECRRRAAKAQAIIRGASYEPADSMLRQGWHQCTDVISAEEALDETEICLESCEVQVTQTAMGYIVWAK